MCNQSPSCCADRDDASGELFAVIARIGETLGIPVSTPNLCRAVESRVSELVGSPLPIARVEALYTGIVDEFGYDIIGLTRSDWDEVQRALRLLRQIEAERA